MIEIDTVPPTTLPARAPTFEVCPIGEGMAVFDVVLYDIAVFDIVAVLNVAVFKVKLS